MTAPRQEQAGTKGRFTEAEIRSFIERDKHKKPSPGQESRAKAKTKPPTFKGIKFPDLAKKKGTRPVVASRSNLHPSVANAARRLDILTKNIKP